MRSWIGPSLLAFVLVGAACSPQPATWQPTAHVLGLTLPSTGTLQLGGTLFGNLPSTGTIPRESLPGGGRIAHGAFPGDLYQGMLQSQAQAVIQNFQQLVGKKLAVVHYYTPSNAFPTVVNDVIANAGAWPLISLSPGQYNLDAITAGADDAAYRHFAQEAKAWSKRTGKPLLIRWGWEMNGSHPWSGALNGANAQASVRYIQAWRHVVDIFRAEQATQVKFVWCVDAWGRGPGDGAEGKWNYFNNYYPGDAYVDWVGVNGFNWPQSTYHTFSEIFDDPTLSARCLSGMERLHNAKPLLIGETATGNAASPSAAWIKDAFNVITSGRYNNLRLACWFNKDQDGADWRLKSGSAATAAYIDAVRSAKVLERVSAL